MHTQVQGSLNSGAVQYKAMGMVAWSTRKQVAGMTFKHAFLRHPKRCLNRLHACAILARESWDQSLVIPSIVHLYLIAQMKTVDRHLHRCEACASNASYTTMSCTSQIARLIVSRMPTTLCGATQILQISVFWLHRRKVCNGSETLCLQGI